jgi:hypothetical protein
MSCDCASSRDRADPVGHRDGRLAWVALLALVRLSTRLVVVESPIEVDAALALIESWLDRPCTTVVNPTDRHAAVLRELLAPLGIAAT